jgi:pSer/pThr/pTyr-binding forkhead associated (FHA) protein
MGTTNGTYLNGQPVPEDGIRLVPGDIIALGNEEIEFR